MLVISRKKSECLTLTVPGLAEPVEILVTSTGPRVVRLAIKAPESVRIYRGDPVPDAVAGDLFPGEPDWMRSGDFCKAWCEWESHRRHKRQTLTPEAARLQRRKLAEWGERRAMDAIQHSIMQGWTGLFEPKTAAINGNNHISVSAQTQAERVKRTLRDATSRSR